MNIELHIDKYITSHPDQKRNDMLLLHHTIIKLIPKCKLWFLNGKDDKGKVISNPNIGYGSFQIHYKDGSTKEFYQIGISANTIGISIYIFGFEDKKYLLEKYGTTLGKASISGYCIKFKELKQIDIEVLKEAIMDGYINSKEL